MNKKNALWFAVTAAVYGLLTQIGATGGYATALRDELMAAGYGGLRLSLQTVNWIGRRIARFMIVDFFLILIALGIMLISRGSDWGKAVSIAFALLTGLPWLLSGVLLDGGRPVVEATEEKMLQEVLSSVTEVLAIIGFWCFFTIAAIVMAPSPIRSPLWAVLFVVVVLIWASYATMTHRKLRWSYWLGMVAITILFASQVVWFGIRDTGYGRVIKGFEANLRQHSARVGATKEGENKEVIADTTRLEKWMFFHVVNNQCEAEGLKVGDEVYGDVKSFKADDSGFTLIHVAAWKVSGKGPREKIGSVYRDCLGAPQADPTPGPTANNAPAPTAPAVGGPTYVLDVMAGDNGKKLTTIPLEKGKKVSYQSYVMDDDDNYVKGPGVEVYNGTDTWFDAMNGINRWHIFGDGQVRCRNLGTRDGKLEIYITG